MCEGVAKVFLGRGGVGRNTVLVVKVNPAKYSTCELPRISIIESLSPQRSDIPDVSDSWFPIDFLESAARSHGNHCWFVQVASDERVLWECPGCLFVFGIQISYWLVRDWIGGFLNRLTPLLLLGDVTFFA